MTLSEYSQLKNCIVYAVVGQDRHSEILSSIKEIFRDGINSVRRFEQINTIGQLLSVLEIRDILSEDNVECLKKIASKLPNSDELIMKISNYEGNRVPRQFHTYHVPNQREEKKQQSYISMNSAPTTRIMSNTKKDRIFQTVIEEIGGHWRDLARNLQIRECEINEIDIQNKTITEKAYKLMETYEYKKADPDRWFLNLCEALEKTRRKDLSKTLQYIMVMNI